ncbi:MAG: dual specificity protein phosphatase family protein [Chloroflexi bacterium]|nr:dual specificity protein phosphatase family protein [Chloroflexota bacterium]
MIKRPLSESYWVEENRFLAGEYPGGHESGITRRQMDAFLESGINTFIDLTHANELAPYEPILQEQAHQHGMDAYYHRFPIRDHGVPSVELMRDILNAIDTALRAGQGVYVHCWGGVGRTGVTVGCYLVRHGMPNEEALTMVNTLYKTRSANFHYPNSPETEEQIEFVRNWRENSP